MSHNENFSLQTVKSNKENNAQLVALIKLWPPDTYDQCQSYDHQIAVWSYDPGFDPSDPGTEKFLPAQVLKQLLCFC
jgi:hypothetical protein